LKQVKNDSHQLEISLHLTFLNSKTLKISETQNQFVETLELMAKVLKALSV